MRYIWLFLGISFCMASPAKDPVPEPSNAPATADIKKETSSNVRPVGTASSAQLGTQAVVDGVTLPLTATIDDSNDFAFNITNTSTGGAIRGVAVAGGDGVLGMTASGNGSSGAGVRGFGSNGSWGVFGSSDTGYGVFGTSQLAGVWGQSTGAGPTADGVHGESSAAAGQGSGVAGFNHGGGPGIYGQSASGDGIFGTANDSAHSGVAAINTGNGIGVYARSANGYAFFADGPIRQRQDQNGLVKFAVRVKGVNGNYGITSCFNSQLPAAQSTTPPCGIAFAHPAAGNFVMDFGLPMATTFPSVTTIFGGTPTTLAVVCKKNPSCNLGDTQIEVETGSSDDAAHVDADFNLVIL